MDTCICMAETLCYSPETIKTLLISHASIQNKKFNLKKRWLAGKKNSSNNLNLQIYLIIQICSFIKQKQTHRLRKLMVAKGESESVSPSVMSDSS